MTKKPSAKQTEAMQRNWGIHILRGIQHNLTHLSPARQQQVRDIIDEQLRELGAMTYDQHLERLRRDAEEFKRNARTTTEITT